MLRFILRRLLADGGSRLRPVPARLPLAARPSPVAPSRPSSVSGPPPRRGDGPDQGARPRPARLGAVRQVRSSGRSAASSAPRTAVLPGRDAFDIFLTALPGHHRAERLSPSSSPSSSAIPLGYLGRAAARLAVRQRSRRLLAHRRGGPGLLPRLPAQVPASPSSATWLARLRAPGPGLGCTRVTGFFVLDGLLTRELDARPNALKHLVLPAVRSRRSRSRWSSGSPGPRSSTSSTRTTCAPPSPRA